MLPFLSRFKTSSLVITRRCSPRTVSHNCTYRYYTTPAADKVQGLGFDLSEEQKAIQDLARNFAKEKIIPVAAELDRTGTFPKDIIKEAHSIGLLNTHIPEQFGGPGLGIIEATLLAEEIAYGCSGVCTAFAANDLAQMPLILGGSDELKKNIFHVVLMSLLV